jgi:hypothetical protein
MKKFNPLLAGVFGALCSPEGGTGGAETAAKRERQFTRVYDHEKGTVTFGSVFDKDFSLVLDINSMPIEMVRGFALQNIADYIANEGNETLKDKNVAEGERKAKSLESMREALQEVTEGKIDFRSGGTGLGGMRSTINLVAEALFQLGKTFVKNQRGETLSWTDLHGARAALKTLYNDTTPKGPFEPVKNPDGSPALDKEGKQRMRAVAKDSNLTGRMIFSAIQEVPAVKEKIAELKPQDNKSGPVVELG